MMTTAESEPARPMARDPILRDPVGAARITKILLATDLEEASTAASAQAIELSAGLGAALLIVSVIDPRSLHLPGGGVASRVDQVRSAREAAAKSIVSDGQAAGVRVQFLIWEGEPGEGIVDAAKSEGAGLIVVGSHGRGGMGRFLIGSVSDFVVRNAHCPVMVVRGSIGRT